jgi:hypothetical protein
LGFAVALATFPACTIKTQPKVGESLQVLSTTFGIGWPTNLSNAIAGEFKYFAPLDGSSRNHQRFLRFEVSPDDFATWRGSITNQLKEFVQFGMSRDPDTMKRFHWWDGHTFPSEHVTHYFKEATSNDVYLAQLSIFVVDLRGSSRFYVKAHILTRGE